MFRVINSRLYCGNCIYKAASYFFYFFRKSTGKLIYGIFHRKLSFGIYNINYGFGLRKVYTAV